MTHHSLLQSAQQQFVGNSTHLSIVLDFVQVAHANLHPQNRPAGVFLCAGPTGTGKTYTAQVLARLLHNNESKVLKIACGEFQMDHEVAKLIGAPPGYLGHRETSPMLSQQKVNAVASERSELSLVLFDEIEKAAPSMQRILLGLLGDAEARMGDGTTTYFGKSLIFMTSNLGAQEAMAAPVKKRSALYHAAIHKHFSPEFVNRIDRVMIYEPLTFAGILKILDLELEKMHAHWRTAHGPQAPQVQLSDDCRQWLAACAQPERFGAREIKRLLFRHVTVPLAQQPNMLGGHFALELDNGAPQLFLRSKRATRLTAPSA